MPKYDVAVIGTGADSGEVSKDGFAIGYRHGEAYEAITECRLVACADIVEENARAFADEFGLDEVYTSYERMIEAVEPDLVSVSVPPATHAEVVLDCARQGIVDAIHCEKPMATRWDDCQAMVEVCDRRDVQLTFNHQRRFGRPFQVARERLDAGDIGDLVRIECSAKNVYDYGSHLLDLCGYFNENRPAEWVLGQIDYREENKWFGAHNENQAVATWEYDNGVTGLVATGDLTGVDLVGAHHRLIGTEGTIEIGRGYPSDIDPDHHVTVTPDGAEPEVVETTDDGLHDSACFTRALESVVSALDSDDDSPLAATNALKATEVIFGIWESARRRGRIEFPLTIDGNPLEEMVESGALDPSPAE